MNAITKAAAGHMASNTISQMKANISSSNQTTIQWDNFNFPPLLKLFHFSLEELNPPIKGIVRNMFFSFCLFMFSILWSLINNIVQVAEGYDGLRIFYAFLNIFLFSPIVLYVFYKGYKGMAQNSANLFIYKIMQAILLLLYFAISIMPVGGFNGWVRVKLLFDEKHKAPGALSIIESLCYTVNYILAGICIYQSQKEDFDKI